MSFERSRDTKKEGRERQIHKGGEIERERESQKRERERKRERCSNDIIISCKNY